MLCFFDFFGTFVGGGGGVRIMFGFFLDCNRFGAWWVMLCGLGCCWGFLLVESFLLSLFSALFGFFCVFFLGVLVWGLICFCLVFVSWVGSSARLSYWFFWVVLTYLWWA